MDMEDVFRLSDDEIEARMVIEEVEQESTLYRIARPDNPVPMHFVSVSCPSTGRRYVLRVNPDITSAAEARASTFGVRKVEGGALAFAPRFEA
jgi:hypothetical protein